jgi:membrane fusion protein YbhG
MNKRLIAVVVLGAVVLGGGGWFAYTRLQDNHRELKLFGNVDIRQVNLGFRVSGRIAEMRYEEGDRVRAGEVIAVLDEGPYLDQVNIARAQLAQAEANLRKLVNGYRKEEIAQARARLAQAKANFDNARATFARQDELLRTKVISQQEYDNATASRDALLADMQSAQANLDLLEAGNRSEDIEAARAQADHLRANLESAQRSLADCKLVAPTNGTILTRALEPGAIVAAETAPYALSLDTPVWVRAYIDEPDLGRIYPGMKALVYTDAAPDKPYEAQIGFISPIAEFTPKTVETRQLRTDLVFRLRVIVSRPDEYLRQGMPVTVDLLEDQNERSGTRGRP